MSKSPRKSKIANEASIIDGSLYFEDVKQCVMSDDIFVEMLGEKTLSAIRLVSLSSNWQQNVWLGNGVTVKETLNFEMTLRKEVRGGTAHWYAYRRVYGKLFKRYVGRSENINVWKLVEIAQKMPTKG